MSFKPIQGQLGKRNQINLSVSQDERDRIKAAAAKARLTISPFVRQCVFYAMDNMEE